MKCNRERRDKICTSFPDLSIILENTVNKWNFYLQFVKNKLNQCDRYYTFETGEAVQACSHCLGADITGNPVLQCRSFQSRVRRLEYLWLVSRNQTAFYIEQKAVWLRETSMLECFLHVCFLFSLAFVWLLSLFPD